MLFRSITIWSWDQLEAFPMQALSPLGAFACGMHLSPQVVSLQNGDKQSILRDAAQKGFKGCLKEDLLKLAKELGVPSVKWETYALFSNVSCSLPL